MSSLMNIGACPSALNPTCACSLWRTVGNQTSLYGCELWNNLTIHETESLERAQKFDAKRIQGLHPMTRSEAATGSLGLWSMEGTIDKAKLLYFGRLCRLHETLLKRKFLLSAFLLTTLVPTNKQLDLYQILFKFLTNILYATNCLHTKKKIRFLPCYHGRRWPATTSTSLKYKNGKMEC